MYLYEYAEIKIFILVFHTLADLKTFGKPKGFLFDFLRVVKQKMFRMIIKIYQIEGVLCRHRAKVPTWAL